jgi:hypothetical protein
MVKKFIFILPNIYEIVNGVSTKYIKFINYLTKSYEVILFTTFNKINESSLSEQINLKIIKTNGLNVPFYKEIKIPIIKYKDIESHITNGNEVIIFNGEFIWIYDSLIKLKKQHDNIKIYPTMHTDYVYYANQIYSLSKFTKTLNYLDYYLENKKFTGIIVTGDKMKEKYINCTNSIFNANEINLEIFNNHKIDDYDLDNTLINFIYTGRISKEKNIEEIFLYINYLQIKLQNNSQEKYKNFDFIVNIIGTGPYLDNLKTIIELQYKNIYSKVVFHGNKEQSEINKLYQTLDNRIFIFTSLSETFGKTPMEACATGIPIFIKDCDNTQYLYKNKKNAFIFNDKDEFINNFEYFIKMKSFEKQIFISESINNVKKYDQTLIFSNWLDFLIHGSINKKNNNQLNLMNIFTFHGISNLINCSGTILGD